MKRYHADMRRLAGTYDIKFIDFVHLAKLLKREFFDIGHVVKSGRRKWQRVLSDRTVAPLRTCGMGPTVAGGSGASD